MIDTIKFILIEFVHNLVNYSSLKISEYLPREHIELIHIYLS